MDSERSTSERRSRTALSTSIRDNSTAFGFSLTATASFGLLQKLEGSPSVGEIVAFGAAAAAAVGMLQALVTSGFRAAPRQAPTKVILLGTALDFVSVAAGTGAALAVAELLAGFAAWPVAAAAAVSVFLLTETLEFVLAEFIQRRRGEPGAE